MSDPLPLPIDWNASGLSRHAQMAIMAASRPLIDFIGDAITPRINLVFPLKDGRESWMFRVIGEDDDRRYVVRHLPLAETGRAFEYDEPQCLHVICKRPQAERRHKFNLDGMLTPLDHSIVLTALAGIPGGADLGLLGQKPKGPRYFTLIELHRRNPSLVDQATYEPMLGDTMSSFVAGARQMIVAQTARQDFFA